jgi:DNA polymerase-3 subunit gamma/tau
LQLTSTEGGIGKKKLTDSPVGFRVTPIRAAKTEIKSPEPKLVIQTKKEPAVVAEATAIPVQTENIPSSNGKSSKLSSLEKIRRKVSSANENVSTLSANALSEEELHHAWGSFIKILKDEKSPAAQNFIMAELRISDAENLLIVVRNNIQQRFIENERLRLLEHLQTHFNSKSLSFSLVLEEKNGVAETGPVQLSKKEQYLKIIEQYPLVKELKDRLKMDLDY